MKRYTIHGVAASQGRELKNQPYTACEDPEGLWVKWEGAEKEIKAAYESGYFTGQNNKWTVCTCDMMPCTCGAGIGLLESRSKCNCEEVAVKFCRNEITAEDYFWICPIHGYKKR